MNIPRINKEKYQNYQVAVDRKLAINAEKL